jgi:hypothetical protein
LHIAQAAQAGLFAELPADATLAVANSAYPFRAGTDDYRDARNLFYHYAHREYRIAAARDVEKNGAPSARVWYLRLNAPQQILGNPSVVAAHWSYAKGQTIFTDEARGYRRYASKAEAKAARELFSRRGRGVQRRLVDAGDLSAIVRARRTCGPVPVQAAFERNVPRVRWGSGFYAPELYPRAVMSQAIAYMVPSQAPFARFAGARARLIVDASACAPVPLRVSMTAFSDAPAHLDVRAGTYFRRYRVSQTGVFVSVPVPKSDARRFTIALSTDGPRAAEIADAQRYERTDNRDVRLFVAHPVVEDGT